MMELFGPAGKLGHVVERDSNGKYTGISDVENSNVLQHFILSGGDAKMVAENQEIFKLKKIKGLVTRRPWKSILAVRIRRVIKILTLN